MASDVTSHSPDGPFGAEVASLWSAVQARQHREGGTGAVAVPLGLEICRPFDRGRREGPLPQLLNIPTGAGKSAAAVLAFGGGVRALASLALPIQVQQREGYR